MSSKTQPGVSSLSSMPSEIERSAARYLFAVSILSETGERIKTGELKDYLDVTPASATEMISKLDERGLTDYEKYHGVTLTKRGEAIARQTAWRFCIVSTYFDTELDTALDEQMAFNIAFTLPRDGVFSLRDLVSSPCLRLCPESGGGFDECVV